jgi:hypothetical protein
MRYTEKAHILKDRFGEEKETTKYLWFPMCLPIKEHSTVEQWRWLEKATYVSEVKEIDVGGSGQWGCYKYVWRPQYWKDEG